MEVRALAMELRTETVDRVLEALSPALAAELARVINETRQTIEAEFVKRSHDAALEAEAERQQAVQRAVKEAVGRVIQETTEAVTQRVTQELQAQFDQKVESRENAFKNAENDFRKCEDQFKKSQNDWNAERERLQKQVEHWRVFAEGQRQLVEAESQAEILVRSLNLGETFGSSIAIYTAKSDGLALWKSRGKAVFPEITSQETRDPEYYFKPIVVRGKTVAALSAQQPYRAESLDFLAASMQLAIELFGLKLRNKS
jgi:hypothetical protein